MPSKPLLTEDSDGPGIHGYHLTVGRNDSGRCESLSGKNIGINGTVQIQMSQVKTVNFAELRLTSSILGTVPSQFLPPRSILSSAFPDKPILRIWERGRPIPSPSGNELIVSFSMPLPRDTPPSADHRKDVGPFTITYKLTLHVERRWPRDNIELHRDISISHSLTREARELPVHWGTGGDLVRENSINLRRAKNQDIIHMRIWLPGQDRPYPLDTRAFFPFVVTVTTFSLPSEYNAFAKPGKAASTLTLKSNVKYLHELLQFRLLRKITAPIIGSDSSKAEYDKLKPVSTFCASLGKLDETTLAIGKPEWVQYLNLNGKGRWVQQFVFRSEFDLTTEFITPTFRSEAFNISYELDLRAWDPIYINGSAAKDSLKIVIPVEIYRPDTGDHGYSSDTGGLGTVVAHPIYPHKSAIATDPSIPSSDIISEGINAYSGFSSNPDRRSPSGLSTPVRHSLASSSVSPQLRPAASWSGYNMNGFTSSANESPVVPSSHARENRASSFSPRLQSTNSWNADWLRETPSAAEPASFSGSSPERPISNHYSVLRGGETVLSPSSGQADDEERRMRARQLEEHIRMLQQEMHSLAITPERVQSAPGWDSLASAPPVIPSRPNRAVSFPVISEESHTFAQHRPPLQHPPSMPTTQYQGPSSDGQLHISENEHGESLEELPPSYDMVDRMTRHEFSGPR